MLSELAKDLAYGIDALQVRIERERAEKNLKEERALLARRVEERTAELSIANAELARASRQKDDFLASMSHELRTPLNTILGMCETLQEGVYGPLKDKQFKPLQNIQLRGRHLLSLINDILDVSKIVAGKLELQIVPISIESVCNASLRLIRQNAHKKRLKLALTIDSTVTIFWTDERRLKQILVNLLSNAVKFTPEGGEIGLEVIGDTENQVIRFTIWDTGIGISSENMTRLFKPFVQLDTSLSRQHTGTGLGLALVYRLTKLNGGSVSVESEVGKGSRFTVTLPWQKSGELKLPAGLDEKEESDRTAVVLQEKKIKKKHGLILIAEDNEDNINMVSNYLKAKGYQVVMARNGTEAVERARERRPDTILMDIQMPDMDGLEATRYIRNDLNLRDIPIIAITALAMPGDRERCLKEGADEYMCKPVSLKTLIKTIEKQIAAKR